MVTWTQLWTESQTDTTENITCPTPSLVGGKNSIDDMLSTELHEENFISKACGCPMFEKHFKGSVQKAKFENGVVV